METHMKIEPFFTKDDLRFIAAMFLLGLVLGFLGGKAAALVRSLPC